MSGSRGVRKEGPFESPTPGASHMPAKTPTKQRDFGGSGKRGSKDSDFSGNSMKQPKELRPSLDQGGDESFTTGVKTNIDMARGFDPRRSHS